MFPNWAQAKCEPIFADGLIQSGGWNLWCSRPAHILDNHMRHELSSTVPSPSGMAFSSCCQPPLTCDNEK